MTAWPEDPVALVQEACADCRIDPERSERDGAVLLMLAMYNITGSLDWGQGWASAIASALGRGGALSPTRAQLVLYRQQMAECPWALSDVAGADPVLLSDLAGALTQR